MFVMNQMSASAIHSVVPFSRGRRGNGANGGGAGAGNNNDRPIRFRCFLQNTILDVLKNRGWIEIE